LISYDIVEHGQPLQKAIRHTPEPGPGEVLMQITHAGVCHSDLHIWEGYFDLGGGKRSYVKDRGVKLPFTMGHEPLGVVAKLGAGVSGVTVGSKYLVYPWIGCGKCSACESGHDNYCVTAPRFIGAIKSGAYASHLLVPDSKYLIDVTGIDDGFAATLACSGVTAYSAIAKLPAVTDRDHVAVVGCGGLGLVCISLLRAKGVKNIVACDVDETKLAAARAQGATWTVNTRDADAAAKLAAAVSGSLVGAIDFVGRPETAQLAMGALRKGGRAILVGLHGGEISIPLPPIAQRAIGLVGSYVGTLGELRELVALVRTANLKPLPVQLRPSAEVNQILDDLKAGSVLGRVVMQMETAA